MALIATISSGRDVEKATKRKPKTYWRSLRFTEMAAKLATVTPLAKAMMMTPAIRPMKYMAIGNAIHNKPLRKFAIPMH